MARPGAVLPDYLRVDDRRRGGGLLGGAAQRSRPGVGAGRSDPLDVADLDVSLLPEQPARTIETTRCLSEEYCIRCASHGHFVPGCLGQEWTGALGAVVYAAGARASRRTPGLLSCPSRLPVSSEGYLRRWRNLLGTAGRAAYTAPWLSVTVMGREPTGKCRFGEQEVN